ncbi:MAG: hypothetical protein RBS10_01270 [Thauera propionica]|jgi:hypothetical protein|nr:hypothetical protein [Thauera propionica]
MSQVTSLADIKAGKSNAVSSFNPDAWHAMQARDDQLIRDSVLHGYAGKEYVYSFKIQGTQVTGVSVVGARELASHYGGIKHRIVASVDKTGSLFVFKSFEPLAVQANIIPQLAGEEDFYEVVIEITDIKTGNSIQVRKKETKQEKRRDGSAYDRPHYDVIAESKAYRNGVLSIIPQNVIKEFEERALKAGHAGETKTLDQLRSGALAFCAKNGIAVERQSIANLTYAELQGLSASAANGVEAFRESAEALGLTRKAAAPAPALTEQQPVTMPPLQTKAGTPAYVDRETGEIQEPQHRQVEPQSGPGFADAQAAVRSGDFDLARDIARALPEQQRQQIEAAIANLSPAREESENPEPAAQPARRSRGQGGLSLE